MYVDNQTEKQKSGDRELTCSKIYFRTTEEFSLFKENPQESNAICIFLHKQEFSGHAHLKYAIKKKGHKCPFCDTMYFHTESASSKEHYQVIAFNKCILQALVFNVACTFLTRILWRLDVLEISQTGVLRLQEQKNQYC